MNTVPCYSRPAGPLGAAVCLGLALVLLVCMPVFGEDPLYMQRPHDEITLDENNDNAVLKVKLLDLPGRKVPPPEQRQGELEIELLIRPGDRFKVDWSAITNIVLFETRLLASAAEHVRAGESDEAFRYYQLLEARFPQTAGLPEAVQGFLWTQITTAYRAGRLDETLALLVELHARNPKWPGLAKAYERVSLTLVDRELAAGNFRAVRRLLENLRLRFPTAQAATEGLEQQLQDRARKLQDEAKRLLATGNGRLAWHACREMFHVWPALEGSHALAKQVHAQYPVVSVGTTSPAGAQDVWRANSQVNFAAARVQRLLARPLVEATFDPEGQSLCFTSPWGEIEQSETGSKLSIQLRSNLVYGAPPQPLSAPHVAASLLNTGSLAPRTFHRHGAKRLVAIAAPAPQRIEFTFRPGVAHEAAWLQVPLFFQAGTSNGPWLPVGPFQLADSVDGISRFLSRTDYPLAQPGQPAEIVERAFSDDGSALQALRLGEISAVDRVSPWELPRITAQPDLVVVRYAVPRVHLLVANPRRPIGSNRSLRRAVLHAIDRDSIVRDGLLAGQEVAGCHLVGGLLPQVPAGQEAVRANQSSVEPAAYDPGLAATLAKLGPSQLREDSSAPLILLYPATPVPRVACQSIANQLQLVGIPVELRELRNNDSPVEEDWDLMYVESHMMEPARDIWRLLGSDGLAGEPTPAMLRALRELEEAKEAAQVTAALAAIDRLAAIEVTIIPLWQLVDHAVYHRSLQGVGTPVVSLYDNVENWQTEFRVPAE